MPTRYHPAGVHTANIPWSDRPASLPAPPHPAPFVTITWQAGAERISLPGQLAQKLADAQPRHPAWSHWDVELIDKVATSCHLPPEVIASLERSRHSWFDDLLTGISGRTDQMVIFHCIRDAIRELARRGHAVIAGHGSVYMTRDLPGGLHVRVIAPLELRISNIAKHLDLPTEQAGRMLHRLNRQREAFFHRFWPDRPLAMEMFAAVFNIAELDDQRLADAIAAMLPKQGYG